MLRQVPHAGYIKFHHALLLFESSPRLEQLLVGEDEHNRFETSLSGTEPKVGQ